MSPALDFPAGSDGKASAYNAGDPDSIPGLGRSPGEGNGNALQYSCLENPMDGGGCQATVHGVTKSQAGLSDFTFARSTATRKDKISQKGLVKKQKHVLEQATLYYIIVSTEFKEKHTRAR